ncbi:hypothetical protein BC940DRAFT_307926 [Gongronella butleri]|nr:hypothetical protein BC940DRAFT_307926 [Gongronella butleri]
MAFIHTGAYPSPQWDEGLMNGGYCDLLNVSLDYPSPNVSPCMNDDLGLKYESVAMSSAGVSSSELSMQAAPGVSAPMMMNASSFMMVPPLQYDASLNLDLVDQFIHHHKTVLSQACTPHYDQLACCSHDTVHATSYLATPPVYQQQQQPVDHQQQQEQQQEQPQEVADQGKKRKAGGQTRRKRASRKQEVNTEYPCPHCPKIFNRPYNLQSHLRTHSTDRPYECNSCGRRFARQHDRNRHQRLHWGFKPYACTQCKKAFARMDALNRHLRVDNGCGAQLGFMP